MTLRNKLSFHRFIVKSDEIRQRKRDRFRNFFGSHYRSFRPKRGEEPLVSDTHSKMSSTKSSFSIMRTLDPHAKASITWDTIQSDVFRHYEPLEDTYRRPDIVQDIVEEEYSFGYNGTDSLQKSPIDGLLNTPTRGLYTSGTINQSTSDTTLDSLDIKPPYTPKYDHSFDINTPPSIIPKTQLAKWERSQMLRHTASKHDLVSLRSKRSHTEEIETSPTIGVVPSLFRSFTDLFHTRSGTSIFGSDPNSSISVSV